MKLPPECASHDALKMSRDDFGFAHVLMKYALRKDIAAFTFAGLRVPAILRQAEMNRSAAPAPSTELELTIFQDHLHDRITMLTENNRMVREIWAFNERSRAFREFLFAASDTAQHTIHLMGELVSALHTCSQDAALTAMDRKIAWYQERIDILLSQPTLPQQEAKR